MAPMNLGLVGIAFAVTVIAKKMQLLLLVTTFERMRMIIDIGPITGPALYLQPF